MALDIQAGPHPAFAATTSAGTTCTQIRGRPHTSVNVYASAAIYVFNGVDDGGTVAGATARKALTADQAAAGFPVTFGGPLAGQNYATVCVAAQSGTCTVEAHSVPPERAG